MIAKLFRVSGLAALTLVAFSATASAQSSMKFGALAGVDFTNLTGDSVSGLSSKTGFAGGLYVAFPMGKSVMIEPELLYVNKGAKDNTVSPTQSLSINYIQIPVLVRYNFKADGGPFILLGPSVGFSTSCNFSNGAASADCKGLGAEVKTTYSGIVGLGFQKGRFGLEGRYDYDFGDAFKDTAAKNTAWEILARIGFNK
jgi:Outer membrane protein beta-barrel domain